MLYLGIKKASHRARLFSINLMRKIKHQMDDVERLFRHDLDQLK